MNTKASSRALLIMLAASTFSPTETMETKGSVKNNNEMIYAAIGVAAISAFSYAMYWYLSPSDEDVCSDAHYLLMGYKGDYTTIIQIAEKHMQTRGISLHDALTYVQNVDEDTLYALAVAKHHKESIAVYHAQLTAGLKKLQSYYDELYKRSIKQKDADLRNTMTLTIDSLKQFIDGMSLLDRIFTCHTSYFALYESEAKTGVKYAEEFKILGETVSNLFAQEDAVRRYIITRSKTSSLPFARVEYVNRIDRDIKNLEYVIKQVKIGYPNRLASAQNYVEALKSIKSYIITDQNYTQEMIQYQQDQREKERLRIEKEKADAEIRAARAAERKAQAEQDKAYAKHREARAQERVARAQEEANRIAHANNVSPQTVHVVHHQSQ